VKQFFFCCKAVVEEGKTVAHMLSLPTFPQPAPFSHCILSPSQARRQILNVSPELRETAFIAKSPVLLWSFTLRQDLCTTVLLLTSENSEAEYDS